MDRQTIEVDTIIDDSKLVKFRKSFRQSELVWSPDVFHEAEWLIFGIVTGAKVEAPSGPGHQSGMTKLNSMDLIRKMISLLFSADQPKLLNEAFYKLPFRVNLGAVLDKDETIKIYSRRSSLQKNVKLSGKF